MGVFLPKEEKVDWQLQWSGDQPDTYHVTLKHQEWPGVDTKPLTAQLIVLARHGPYYIQEFVATVTMLTCDDAIKLEQKKNIDQLAMFKNSGTSVNESESAAAAKLELIGAIGEDLDQIVERCTLDDSPRIAAEEETGADGEMTRTSKQPCPERSLGGVLPTIDSM